ncbi:hypothetical protein [Xanthobacter sp. KR7-225]|uniref:hypothetical protein n=1 Tax=Xanthobacter sp. KR7-225 TaxID=3156613 RepID=UPI0032B47490
MCCFYEYEDGNKYRPFVPASHVVRARARAEEARMPGETVPEAAWEAFFSPTCGAIPFAHFERMFRARQKAVGLLAMTAPARRPLRAPTGFKAVAV